MRRDATDPPPDPENRGLGPAGERRGRARPSRVNRELAALIGVTMIGLVWFSTLDSGREPPRLRMARGDPRTHSIALAFSPDGTTIATVQADGRVALRSPTEGGSLQRLLGYAASPGLSPSRPTADTSRSGDPSPASPCATSRPREPNAP